MFALVLLSACLINRDLYEQRKEELTDHDGDSFAQEDDCDDADITVFPGADEVCDGVDQDCDGEADEGATDATTWYPDADSDGHGVVADAVVSCDSPGTAYAELPDDCDDANASAHPGGTETAYDGVDQDCDGGDLDDLDGDGWTSELTGGGDCDDTEPGVHPDAEETWVNGVTDNDCNGEIEAIQLDYGSASWAGWRAEEGIGRRVAALGDVDDDGLADIVIGTELDGTLGEHSGALYRVDGAAGGSIEGAPALLPTAPGQYFGAGVDAGVDVTGDGTNDLLVTALGSDTSAGGAWIVDGGAWEAAGSAAVTAVAWGQVAADLAGTYSPSSARFVGDVNGDGVEDVALGECCVDGVAPGTIGRVAVFSTDAFTGTLSDAEVIIDGPWEDAYYGYAIDRLGDQDGDGLPEILVSSGGGLAGSIVAGNASGNVADLASTLIYGEVPGTTVRGVDDLDGDGRDDLAIVGQDNVISFLTVLNSTPTRVADTPTFTFTWSEHSGVYDVLPLGDLDQDGRSEVLIPQAWSDSGTQRLWILMGEDVTAGGTISADTATLSGVSSVPAALFGYSMALAGDVDGDGHDDVVLGAPEYSAGEHYAGGATLIAVPE